MAGVSFYTVSLAMCEIALSVSRLFSPPSHGESRPYLGVHYVEDILLGWTVGLGVGLFAVRYGERIGAAWTRLGFPAYRLCCSDERYPLGFRGRDELLANRRSAARVSLLRRTVTTSLLPARWNWSSSISIREVRPSPVKILRHILAVGLSLLVLEALGKLLALIADNYSLAGCSLQYVRYITVSIVSLFVAPWIFVRCRLAKTAVTTPTWRPLQWLRPLICRKQPRLYRPQRGRGRWRGIIGVSATLCHAEAVLPRHAV
jgi:hypothetical protein